MSARTITEPIEKCGGCGCLPGITDRLAGRTHLYQVACAPCRAATDWTEDMEDAVSHWNDAIRARAQLLDFRPETLDFAQ